MLNNNWGREDWNYQSIGSIIYNVLEIQETWAQILSQHGTFKNCKLGIEICNTNAMNKDKYFWNKYIHIYT